MATEITTPVGRLVGGHPMVASPVMDDRTGQPKTDATGQPRTETYIGLAIPKQGEANWQQTEWGQKIYSQAAADWPAGEYGAPSFAWKIIDGDSQVPNKRGRKPCDREGFPGHWVLNLSTALAVKCFHAGRYDPTQQIQDKNEIKPGDYCRVVINCKGNNPSQSPGVYLNPSLFELTRAGVAIQLDTGPSAAEAFGGSAPQLPPGAQIDPGVSATPPVQTPPVQTPPVQTPPVQTPPAQPPAATPPAAPVQPAPDFLQPPAAPAKPKRVYQGQTYTEEQLAGWGWTPEQIASLPTD